MVRDQAKSQEQLEKISFNLNAIVPSFICLVILMLLGVLFRLYLASFIIAENETPLWIDACGLCYNILVFILGVALIIATIKTLYATFFYDWNSAVKFGVFLILIPLLLFPFSGIIILFIVVYFSISSLKKNGIKVTKVSLNIFKDLVDTSQFD